MFQWREITCCRLCKSEKIKTLLNLGSHYVVNFVDAADLPAWKAGERETPVPLTLVICESCSYVQLKESVDPERLYRNFWYKSGINEAMRRTLREINDEAIGLSKCPIDGAVLDIGSNDGTQLSFFPDTMLKVGVDPAVNLQSEAKKTARTFYIYADFFDGSDKTYESLTEAFSKAGYPKSKSKFHIISAISMFYDLEDPESFLNLCADFLDDDGVIVIQMNYLLSMLSNNAIDNIAHEHLGYYSLMALNNLAIRCSLRIIDASVNDVNGGSLRVYLGHDRLESGSIGRERFYNLLRFEQTCDLANLAKYQLFLNRSIGIFNKIADYVCDKASSGEQVYLYGASTRGTALLQFMEQFGSPSIKDMIAGVAERNPEKVGKHMVGSWLPIVSEQEAREKAQSFIVLPYHFKRAILEREDNELQRGVELMFPLSDPCVYSARRL